MSRRGRFGILAGALLAAALVVNLALAQRGMGGYGNGYGPGAYGPGMMGIGVGVRGSQVLDWSGAQATIEAGAAGASVDAASNTVSFTGANVTLDVIAVQPGEPDTTFEIAGLVDPTVKVPRGALVTLRLVNMDYGADMPHGVVITRLPPPYTVMPMLMMGGMGPGIPPLVARSADDLRSARYAAAAVRFRAAVRGTYYYLCQVPGHARDGMYGKLIVE